MKASLGGSVANATHMNFAGSELGRDKVVPLVTGTIQEFLAEVSANSCATPGIDSRDKVICEVSRAAQLASRPRRSVCAPES
jgi:hypothetical protein